MDFQGTPLNLTTLIVAALAVVGLITLLRKRYDSNLPLFFYFIALIFTNMSDRAVNPALMYVGLVFALLLRFEFMNTGFAKICAFFATGSLALMIWVLVSEAFSDGTPPF